MPPVLNSPLFRARREELGITERQLADETGVSTTTIRALERATNHADLRVRFLLRLTVALGIRTDDLFAPHQQTPAGPPTTDDAKLEALLREYDGVAHRASLVQALSWDAARLRAAEQRLAARLQGTGTWLQSHWGLAVWPASHLVTDAERAALARHENARSTINTTQAALLRKLLIGELDSRWVANAGKADRMHIAQLVNLGWAERATGGYRATRAVLAGFRPAIDAIRRVEQERDSRPAAVSRRHGH